MLVNLFRDETTVPLVKQRFAAFHDYFMAARRTLMAGRKLRGRPEARTRAALGHAIAFSTWHSLVREEGLSDADAVKLLCAFVATVDRGSRTLEEPLSR